MPKSDGHFLARRMVVLSAFLAVISGAAAAYAVVADNHSSGFTRYARVDRPDGTYRNMLADNASLAALR